MFRPRVPCGHWYSSWQHGPAAVGHAQRGYPVVTRTQVKYQGKPEYFAKELARIAAEGVRILGGCCGTTPAHIAPCGQRWILCLLWKKRPRRCRVSTPEAPTVEKDDAFLRKLNAGKKVIA